MIAMKVDVLEESKKRMVFRVEGEGHTLLNLLKKELWEDPNITVAGYEIRHPLEGIPTMVVETNGKETARDALLEAAKRMKKTSTGFLRLFEKIA